MFPAAVDITKYLLKIIIFLFSHIGDIYIF